MNPSVDDRLNSILRALQATILPALPQEAALAREQLLLTIGHIQILQAQRAATPSYEAEELADLEVLAGKVAAIASDDAACTARREELKRALEHPAGTVTEKADVVRNALDALLIAASQAGSEVYYRQLHGVILPLAAERATKDRRWFAVMGFDAELS